MLSKKYLAVLVCVLLLFGLFLIGCGQEEVKEPVETPDEKVEEPAPEPEKEIRVGVVYSVGGRGDMSFNDSAFVGLERAATELGITFEEVEPKEVAGMETAQTFLAKEGYDLIIAIGFLQGDALKTVSANFPGTKFAIVDSVVDAPNVASLVFKEHEGSFLAGTAAGLMTETDNVGFVGGMDMPLIHKFQAGFEAGVAQVNPEATVQVVYIGTDGSAFRNPGRGKELTLSQIAAGADVIYHASGGSGLGVIDAAAEKGVFAIGVDSDQNHINPATVLTSMVKRVDVAVFEIIKAVVEDNFEGGVHVFGLLEEGVGLCENLGEHASAEVIAKIADIKKEIIAGDIVVPELP